MAEVSFRIDPVHLEQMNRRIGEYLGRNYERSTLARIIEEYEELEAEEERTWDIRSAGTGATCSSSTASRSTRTRSPSLARRSRRLHRGTDEEVVQPVLEEYEG
jgi:hypothetical protein